MIPAIIRYTDDLPPEYGGVAKFFWVRIRPKYRDDKGLHAHELEHVKQWWIVTIVSALALYGLAYALYLPWYILLAAPMVYPFLYEIVDPFTLWCEVQCYRVQMRHYEHDTAPLFARYITEKYDLNVTYDKALELLRG